MRTKLAILSLLTASSALAQTPDVVGQGTVSTAMGEYSPTYDANRQELYFMRRTPELFDYTIMVSKWTGSGWKDAAVASFSGQHRDDGPYLSPDGDALYFDSDRPAEGLEPGSINLWLTRRQGDAWTEPRLLRNASTNPQPYRNAGSDEFGPAVDQAGRVHFYSFRRPFREGRRYVDSNGSTELGSIPDPSWDTFVSYLYIAPKGNWALMDGTAPGARTTDVYFSCRSSTDDWSTPRPLPRINTPDAEGGAWVTPDARTVFFARTMRGEEADIYSAAFENPCAGP